MHVEAFQASHTQENPGHWEVDEDEWGEQPCAHCSCLNDADSVALCCHCHEPYQPMTEIGGRRMFVKDALK